MQNDDRFSIRSCPCCGSSERELLFDLKAKDFCSVNWSYSEDYFGILQIDEDERFPIDLCIPCGFAYARFLPSQDFLKTLYEKVISHEQCRKGSENLESYSRRMRYIANLLELAPKRQHLKALDFGCGLGLSMKLLKCIIDMEVVGYDPSPSRVDYVKETGSIIVQDENRLKDFAPFDLVICDNVLEHVPNPNETLSFIASLSRTDSAHYVSVPSYEKKNIQAQILACKLGLPTDMSLNPWEHLNYFNIYHIDRILRNNGFEPVQFVPGHVDIGLRHISTPVHRIKNSMASTLRLMNYTFTGQAVRNVNNGFYRFKGQYR